MGKIVILDELTSNQIAAGEVVERPSSVVKELIENSIDAKSTSISVEIKNGGIAMIKVTDNGVGLEEDDIQIAFERHATSKIRRPKDLESIMTFGFRGEALASIASVSNIELITCTENMKSGKMIRLTAGKVIDIELCAATTGTSISVNDLFFNTPARYKFLKKDATEAGFVSDIVMRVALGNPHISFKFINNRSVSMHTPGNNDLLSTIFSIYGKEVSKQLLSASYNDSGIKVTGFVGKAEIARANRNSQSIFINKRYIKSKIITAAIDEAYKTVLMKNKYPFVVLNLEINPQIVDVNVHPAKTEVRFSNDQEIFKAIYNAVNNAILYKQDHLFGKSFVSQTSSPNVQRNLVLPVYEQIELTAKLAMQAEAVGLDAVRGTGRGVGAQVGAGVTGRIGASTEAGAGEAVKCGVDEKMGVGAQTRENVGAANVGLESSVNAASITGVTVGVSEVGYSGASAGVSVAKAYDVPNHNDIQNEGYDTGIEGNKVTKIDINSNNLSIGQTDNFIKISENQQYKKYVEIATNKLILDENTQTPVNRAVVNEYVQISANKEVVDEYIQTSANKEVVDEYVQTPVNNAVVDEYGQTSANKEIKDESSQIPTNKVTVDEYAEIPTNKVTVDEYAQIPTNTVTVDEYAEIPTNTVTVDEYAEIPTNKVNIDEYTQTPQNQAIKEEQSINKVNAFIDNDYQVLGQLFQTYIIIQQGNNAFLIDQHAAHERIRFEDLKTKYYNKESVTQMLLMPITLTLTLKEAVFLSENKEFFDKMGFIVDEFGQNSFLLRSAPYSNAVKSEAKELFLFVFDFFINNFVNDKIDVLMEETIYQLACKSAVKANQRLSDSEVRALINELLKLKNPHTCPHGRPTVFKLTKYEIEKLFKRIV